MSACGCLRFISGPDVIVEELPWGSHDWLVRDDLTQSVQLTAVRVTMPAGRAHRFHTHPGREELIYVLSGRVLQYVGREARELGAGDVAHVPTGEVHGSYNVFDAPVVFLAVLSPEHADGLALVDVSGDEPWRSLDPLA
jgi:quercetin dioxygenase-like cupin family protein